MKNKDRLAAIRAARKNPTAPIRPNMGGDVASQPGSVDPQLKNQILEEANRRLAAGEEPDPLCALAQRIENGQLVSNELAKFVWEAHHLGPWRIKTKQELSQWRNLCHESGNPMENSEPYRWIEGQRLYRDDRGDCCFAEAGRGSSIALWTRNDRLYVGFRNEADARKFRSLRKEYGMEATKNRHQALLVLVGWGKWISTEPDFSDDPRGAYSSQYENYPPAPAEGIEQVCGDLNKMFGPAE